MRSAAGSSRRTRFTSWRPVTSRVGIPIATAHNKVLEDRHSAADWTYFSPAAFFELGERTGKFRLGEDDLIADASGNSRISIGSQSAINPSSIREDALEPAPGVLQLPQNCQFSW